MWTYINVYQPLHETLHPLKKKSNYREGYYIVDYSEMKCVQCLHSFSVIYKNTIWTLLILNVWYMWASYNDLDFDIFIRNFHLYFFIFIHQKCNLNIHNSFPRSQTKKGYDKYLCTRSTFWKFYTRHKLVLHFCLKFIPYFLSIAIF